jgi:MFS family permease
MTTGRDPDYGVQRWVTLAACTLAALCCGFFYAWSVLDKPMMAAHGWTSSQVSLAFTLVVAVPAMCTLLAGIFIVGICYGGFLALIGPVTLDVFGPKHFSVNFGIMFLTVAVASYAGPRLAAAVAQANGGDFGRAFLIAAVMTVVGLALMAVYVAVSRRRPAPSAGERSAAGTDDALS